MMLDPDFLDDAHAAGRPHCLYDQQAGRRLQSAEIKQAAHDYALLALLSERLSSPNAAAHRAVLRADAFYADYLSLLRCLAPLPTSAEALNSPAPLKQISSSHHRTRSARHRRLRSISSKKKKQSIR